MRRIALTLLAILLAISLLACVEKPDIEAVAATPDPTEAPTQEPTEAPTQEPTEAPTEVPSCLDKLPGDWRLASFTLNGTEYDVRGQALDPIVKFFEDGTVWLSAQAANGGELYLTYTAVGNAIVFSDENGEADGAVYDPETDAIRMETGGMTLVLMRSEPKQDDGLPEDWTQATLEPYTDDDGNEMVTVTVLIPAGATLRIAFPHQDDYVYTNTKNKEAYRRVKIPAPVFFPNEPLDRTTLTITPQVTITTADGTEHEIACPSFEHTFPMLLLAVDSDGEAGDGAFYAKADKDGVYHLYGMMLSNEDGMPSVDVGVRLTVNGTETVVYQGGIFFADLPCVGNAPTTYVLIAEKDNYLTVSITVVVQPFAEGISADL